MTRTHTPITEPAAPAAPDNNITRGQGAAIVVCLIALTTGLGLFGLRYEQERRANDSKARQECMVANLWDNPEADMRRGC